MLKNKSRWLRAAAPVAVLALALTACSDTDGAKDSDASASAPPSKSGAAEPSDSTSEGGKLGAGERGKGDIKQDKTTSSYVVGALKVDVGTEADTRKLVSDPAKAAGLVPATAYVRFTNDGATIADSPETGDIDVYADGNRGHLLIGAADDSKGCEDEGDVQNWKKGESHVFCNTFMIPEDSKDLEVRWVKNDTDAFTYSWNFKNKQGQ